MKEHQFVRKREVRLAIAWRYLRKSSFEAVISPNLEVFDCQAALASRIASRPQFRCVTGMVGIREHRNFADRGDGLLEQVDALRRKVELQERNSGSVSARPRKA